MSETVAVPTATVEVPVDTWPVPPRRPVVLIVDAAARVRTVLGVLLGQHGFEVLRAADAAEATGLSHKHPGRIDVLLFHNHLSGAESTELLRLARESRPPVRFCVVGGPGQGYGQTEWAGLVVGRVSGPIRPEELVRGLWLLVACAMETAEDDDVAQLTDRERRGWARRACQLTPDCYPLALPAVERWRGQLEDVSASGVRVVLDRPLEPGSLLVLELPGPADSPPRRFVARVLRAVPEADGRWSLGCAFARHLSPDRLEAFARNRATGEESPS